jgi:hypothetical protein
MNKLSKLGISTGTIKADKIGKQKVGKMFVLFTILRYHTIKEKNSREIGASNMMMRQSTKNSDYPLSLI